MKKILFIAVPILVVLIIAGVIVKNSLFSQVAVVDVIPTQAVVFPTVTSDVLVNLTAKNGNRAVKLVISGIPTGTETIEYEMKYTTGSGLIHGFNGTIKLTQDQKKVERDDLTIGSCSSGGKCTYDEGVTSIDVVLKFNAKNGSSVFQKSFPL